MKNATIVVLVLVVLGLGGWVIYDKTKSTDTTATTTDGTTSTTKSSEKPKSSNTLDLNDKD